MRKTWIFYLGLWLGIFYMVNYLFFNFETDKATVWLLWSAIIMLCGLEEKK